MKKVLGALLFGILAVTSASAENVLSVITEPWPPYIIDENGKQGGIEYDIMQAVLKDMGYTMQYKSYPWKRAVDMIKKKEADAILGLFKDAEREQFLFFPETAFLNAVYVFFYKKGNEFVYDGIASLSGKRVGIINGYIYSDEFGKAGGFEKEGVTELEQNLKKLVHGRLDLVLDNQYVGLYLAKQLGLSEQIGYAATPLTAARPHYVAFARKAGYDKLAADFSAKLQAFMQSEDYLK